MMVDCKRLLVATYPAKDELHMGDRSPACSREMVDVACKSEVSFSMNDGSHHV
jgi:hypothetical protein